MRPFENVVIIIFVLLAPVGLVYSWFFYWTKMRKESPSWRRRFTVAALVLASLAVLAWPVRGLLMPTADWASGVGVGHQVRWAEGWERVAVRTLLAALVFSSLGRPRLIVPIALACIGTAMLWVFSTMP